MVSSSKQIFSQSVINLISRVVILLTAFFFYPIVSRFLTKEQVAILAVFEFFPPLVESLVSLGIKTTIIKLLPEKKLKNIEEAKLIVQINVYVIQVLFGLLIILVIFFSKEISKFFLKESKFSTEIIIIAIWSFIYTLSDRLLFVKQGLGEYTHVSYLNIFRWAGSRIFSVISIIGGFGIKGIMFSFMIVFTISIFLIANSIKSLLFPCILFKNHLLMFKYIKYSLPFYFQGWGRVLTSYIDQPLVGFLFKPETLGVYFMVRKLATIIISLFDALREPLVPKLIELNSKNKQEYLRLYNKAMISLNMLMLAGLMLIMIFSSNILYLFAGKQYESYHTYLILFCVYTALFHIFNNINLVLFVEKPPSYIFYSFILTGLINIGASFILGYLINIKWFIVGQSTGFLIVSLILLTKYKILKIQETDIREFFFLFAVSLTVALLLSNTHLIYKVLVLLFIYIFFLTFYHKWLNDIEHIRKLFFLKTRENKI